MISLLLQGIGIATLTIRRHVDQNTREQAEKLPVSVIITNSPNWPATMPGLDNKAFLLVSGTGDLETLFPRLYDAGLRDIAVAPLEFVPISVPASVGAIHICPQSELVYRLQQRECPG